MMVTSWGSGKSTDINSNTVVLRVKQLAGTLNPLVLLPVPLALSLISSATQKDKSSNYDTPVTDHIFPVP